MGWGFVSRFVVVVVGRCRCCSRCMLCVCVVVNEFLVVVVVVVCL